MGMVESGSAGAPRGSGASGDGASGALVSARAIDERVRTEQVRTLFKQSAPVLVANVLNAAILSGALWWRAPHWLLLAWTAAVITMAWSRELMRRRFWLRDWSAQEHEAWGRRFTIGTACAGLLWGFAGGVLLPDSLPHQVVVVFVIGGMAAGAAGTISCFLPAYYVYVVPALVPALIRLLAYGEQVHLAMMAMLSLFVVALSVVARNVNRALVEAFRLRFENAALVDRIGEAQSSLIAANEGLSRANELLERRVRERTAELAESQQSLAEIVRESPDGIVILDDTGAFVTANPAAERIAGRRESEVRGKSFLAVDLLAPGDAERAARVFGRVTEGELDGPSEFSLVRPDGFVVDVEINPRLVAGEDGQRRVHAVVRDVTARHRLGRLKAEYESRLQQAQRLESIGMLAGGVAHDFNNVLTMILNNVDVLAAAATDDTARELLQEIRQGSSQAANLTKQLLAFSRKQLLDVKPASLTHVVKRAQTMFERALGHQNTLTVSLPSDPATVLVDPSQMEQAIINLLVNARYAMPHGGHVSVEIRRLHFETHADWPEVPAGAYALLSVADDGMGMDEATRCRVFDPFFTTRELGQGTGLGLSTVHGIVNQAGGHIRVVSEPGVGTRFEILLPSHTPVDGVASLEVVEERPTTAEWTQGHETVLLVEDHPQVRRAAERILVAAGYTVLVAENGPQALRVLAEHDAGVDVLVTDFVMPGMSGVELIHALREERPTLAVLLMSGYTGSEITVRADLGPDVVFLHKPYDAAEFTASVRAAIDKMTEVRRATPALRA
jgi:two-component system cell cycle sensor histidine kinase/response regulator CckA